MTWSSGKFASKSSPTSGGYLLEINGFASFIRGCCSLQTRIFEESDSGDYLEYYGYLLFVNLLNFLAGPRSVLNVLQFG